MTLAYVQHATTTGADGGGGITFGSTPTVGNLIVMIIVSGTTGTYTNNQNGWTEYANHETGLDLNVSVNYRTVQAGDGVTYAKALSGANITSGRSQSWGYEISGVTSFTSQVETLHLETIAPSSTTATAASQTPASSNDLMMAVGAEFFNVFPGTTTQATSGWTTDVANAGAFNLTGISAHVTTVTGGTAEALTVTFANAATDGVFATLILKAASASTETANVTTTLGGISQSMVANDTHAGITTTLGKATQAMVSTLLENGTINTSLAGITQALLANTEHTGNITTTLAGVSQVMAGTDLTVEGGTIRFWQFGG